MTVAEKPRKRRSTPFHYRFAKPGPEPRRLRDDVSIEPDAHRGSLSEDSLSDARLALRQQTGTDGKTRIQVTPRYLVVGPELDTAAEKLLTAINATTTDDVNPFAGKLTLAVEPRIADDQWYVFADPATVPVIEYSYLSSAPGPQMASRDGWDVLGQEFRVVLDFGCGATDFRGAYRNPGVA